MTSVKDGMVIRDERREDFAAITEVTAAAFKTLAISQKTEQFIIEALRAAGALTVSVVPGLQRQGIGGALIEEGLSRLKALGAEGCCLVGHPEYYRRFGFRNVTGLVHEGVPAEVFMVLAFKGRVPEGKVEFHEGFGATGPAKDAGKAK